MTTTQSVPRTYIKEDFVCGLDEIAPKPQKRALLEQLFDARVASGEDSRTVAADLFRQGLKKTEADPEGTIAAAVQSMDASFTSRNAPRPKPTPPTHPRVAAAGNKVGNALATGQQAVKRRGTHRLASSVPPAEPATPVQPASVTPTVAAPAAPVAAVPAPSVPTAPTMVTTPPATQPATTTSSSSSDDETTTMVDDSNSSLSNGQVAIIFLAGVLGFLIGFFTSMPVVGDRFYGNGNAYGWFFGTILVIIYVVAWTAATALSAWEILQRVGRRRSNPEPWQRRV